MSNQYPKWLAKITDPFTDINCLLVRHSEEDEDEEENEDRNGEEDEETEDEDDGYSE